MQRGGALGGVAWRIGARGRREYCTRDVRGPRALPWRPPPRRRVRAQLPLPRRHLRQALRI